MRILFFLLFFFCSSAFGGVEQISEKEFKDLAAALAPKVNLFREAWEKNSDAEFYGGTTRDYLYWLKGQFIEAQTHEQAEAVVAKLKSLPIIDVREFIIGDSDVDIISAQPGSLDAEKFGVRKIDFQSPDILKPETELGANELLQGYIPAEKIRLSRYGFPESAFTEGVGEIYRGKLSVHFASAEDFAKSKYAKEGINHPILLSLRYLRLQAINYYRTFGKGFPDFDKLHSGIDEASAKQIKDLIERAVRTGELKPYLAKDQFKSWLNGGIQKAFRSYTNPTAALELMKEFGVNRLPDYYPDKIEPLNQYVFTKFREQKSIDQALQNHHVDEKAFYRPLSEYFPDGKLYHGTQTEPAFRGILFQGILPSAGGTADEGLYGVSVANKEFSEKWAGDKNRLIQFDLSPNAKLVDITKGEGRKIWEATHGIHQGNTEKFADLFGVDMIRYPYNTEAFVVKNASVLDRPQGVYRQVKSVGELVDDAKKISDVNKILEMFSVNTLSTGEKDLIWSLSAVPKEKITAFLDNTENLRNSKSITDILTPFWQNQIDVDSYFGGLLHESNKDDALFDAAYDAFFRLFEQTPTAARIDAIDELLAQRRVRMHPSRWNSVLETLTRHKKLFQRPTPRATVLSLENLEKTNGKTNFFYNIMEYLRLNTLTEAELERLLVVAENISEDLSGAGRTHLTQIALNQDPRNQRAHEILLKIAREPKPDEHRIFAIQTLLQSFPDDAEAKELALSYFVKIFPDIRSKLDWYAGQIVEPLAEVPGIREFLLGRAEGSSTGDRKAALHYLNRLKPSDHELARMIKAVKFERGNSLKQLQMLIDGERKRELGPESRKAVADAYANFGYSTEERALLGQVLENYPPLAASPNKGCAGEFAVIGEGK